MSEDKTAGIPRMGFGTWQRDGEEAYNTVTWALEAGYRHIDTAQGYRNEAEVGRAIADSPVGRDEIFITTKVAPDNYGPGEVMRSTKESLEKLRVEAVDLLLLHWPSPHGRDPLGAYVAQLAEVADAGLARHIGVSNFTIALIDEAQRLLGDRKIATNQCEIHVYMQNRPIVDHCRKIGVPMTAYSPLARGRIVDDPLLAKIGTKHGATGEQVALAYLMAEGHIVIPTSSRRERIISNLAARDITLDEENIARLRTLDKGLRLINGAHAPVWD